MAIDYLSTLNKSGSGINITQLVDALVAAEIEPRRALAENKQSEIDLSISELGKLRSGLGELETALSGSNAGQAFDAASSSVAVSVEITDYTALSNTAASMTVEALAQGQILEFAGFASADAALSVADLSIDFGSWSGTTFTADTDRSAETISLTADAMGLDDLAVALNTVSGVAAQVIAKGDGTYSLTVQTDTGAENAIRITSATLTDFDTTDGSNQIRAAADAELTLDGVAITRPGNEITDLIDGVAISLNATTATAASLYVAEDPAIAEAELSAFVDQINGARTLLLDATKRGINGVASGPLVNDPAISVMQREFTALTTTPLSGFGDTPVYLSSFGVSTQRDGSLAFDSDKFQAAFAANPAQYRAMFQSLNSSSSDGITISTQSYANPPAGGYEFDYTAEGTATLNGQQLLSRTVDGVQEFYSVTGSFKGVTLRVTDDYPSTSTVYFGESLLERVREFVSTALDSNGTIDSRDAQYKEDAAVQTETLDDLSLSEVSLAERYTLKFSAMETMITRLNKTSEYLTSLMDAWANQKN